MEYETWNRFEFTQHYSITLKGGESPVEWWMRGATIPKKAFARALRAPLIFPDHLRAVDSWTWRRANNDNDDTSNDKGGGDKSSPLCVVFAMIVTQDETCIHVPVQTAISGEQARRRLGLEVNRQIAQLVGLTLNGGTDS